MISFNSAVSRGCEQTSCEYDESWEIPNFGKSSRKNSSTGNILPPILNIDPGNGLCVLGSICLEK